MDLRSIFLVFTKLKMFKCDHRDAFCALFWQSKEEASQQSSTLGPALSPASADHSTCLIADKVDRGKMCGIGGAR